MRTTTIATLAIACVCGPTALGADEILDRPTAADRQSHYTSLSECTVMRSAPEEAGYSRALCPGAGGYDLHLVDADARQNLFVVTPDGEEHSLRLPSQMGGGFSTLGDTVEWRGPVDGDAFRPDAIIVRYQVVEDAGEPMVETSYLLAISLAETPCLAEKIPPGEAQNERARIAADGAMRCL